MKDGSLQASVPVKPGAMTQLLAELARTPETTGWELPVAAGEVVGRFQILREIGRGGFGVVYEARDTELTRSVAFKAIRQLGVEEPKADQLLAEAEAAARLAHPNIVHLYDLGRCERGPYLILELLHGKTLSERLKEGPLPAREALRISVEMAKGLAHAHGQGVVHRDVKPGNVFLCQDGQVKLLDFGMAHVFGRAGLKGGTPAYMAPEQAAGQPGDERGDVYALGVTLYQLLTGKLPFEDGKGGIPSGGTPPEIPGAPAALVRIVGRMLAREPGERPRDGAEALELLRAFQRTLEPRRQAWLAWSVAAVALVAGGAFALRQRPLPAGRLLTVLADTDNATGDPDLDGVSELLRAGLEQSRRVSVMSRSRLVGILREAGDAVPRTIGEEKAGAAARKAGAPLLVVPGVGSAGGGYDVGVRAVDVQRNETLFSLRESAAAKTTVPAALDRILGDVRRRLDEEPGQAPAAPVAVAAYAPANPEALRHYTDGTRLRSEGRHRQALEPLMKAVAADPDFVLARLAILEDAVWERSEAMDWEDEKLDSFLSALRQGLHRLPAKEQAYADYLIMEASVRTAWAERFTNYTEALRQLDRVIEASPDDPRPYVDAAEFHLDQRGDLEPGRPYVEKAIPFVPYDGSHPFFVRFLLAIGRLDEALARARRIAEAVPSPTSLQQLAMVHIVRGETAEALAVARRAAAGFPAGIPDVGTFLEADALDEVERLLGGREMRMPRWLSLRGRIRDALRVYDARRRAAPRARSASIHLHFQRGFLLLAREDPKALWLETEASFRSGVPAHILACDAWKLALLGDLERGRRLEMMASDRRVCGRMASAILTWKAGDRGEALRLLSSIAAPSSDLHRGEILSEMGRDREAVDLFRVYRRRSGLNIWDDLYDLYNYPRSFYLEAAALERLGEKDEARKVAARLLHLWERADSDRPLLEEARALGKRLGVAPRQPAAGGPR